MEPNVELRQMEAEDLDAPSQGGEAAGRDARTAVLRQAACEHVELRQQLGGTFVAVVPEPPPHERELASVWLELTSSSDRCGVLGQFPLVARDGFVEPGRDLDERAVHRETDRELAHFGAVAVQRQVARASER